MNTPKYEGSRCSSETQTQTQPKPQSLCVSNGVRNNVSKREEIMNAPNASKYNMIIRLAFCLPYPSEKWIVDSGVAMLMLPSHEVLNNLRTTTRKFSFGNNKENKNIPCKIGASQTKVEINIRMLLNLRKLNLSRC